MKLLIVLVKSSKRWILLKDVNSHLESRRVKKTLARNRIKLIDKIMDMPKLIVVLMFYGNTLRGGRAKKSY